MENTDVTNLLTKLKAGKGFAKLATVKVYGDGLMSIRKLTVRLGVAYSDVVGRPTNPLPWGKWLTGFENLIIEHKGNYYLRIIAAETFYTESTYFLNGSVISKAEAISEMKIRNIPESKASDVYSLNIKNILTMTINN